LVFSATPLLLLGLTALGWYVAAWNMMMLWVVRARKLRTPEKWPSFSVLKPLAGYDDELAENLASHLAIDYPGEWKILVGVRSRDDSAYPVARAFAEANPGRVELHLQEGEPGFNPKVNQLITLCRYAKGDVVAITDANVRVHSNILTEHASLIAAHGYALSTNLFCGSGELTVGSALDNMTVNRYDAPSSSTSEEMLDLSQIVGKSMAVRRDVLDELGGWEPVKDFLAEDQGFGRRVFKSGRRVRLCPTPVLNVQRSQPLSQYWGRHTRWAMIRWLVFPGQILEPLINPVPASLAFAVYSDSVFGWAQFAATCLASIAITQACTWRLRGHAFAWKWVLLIPICDLVFPLMFLRALFLRRVSWRGNDFEVGRLTAIRPMKKKLEVAAAPEVPAAPQQVPVRPD
jgi:ceramide glucosyltransferase